MLDLRQRLSELDQLEAPDMRAEIDRRAADLLAMPRDPIIEPIPTPSPWRGPLIALGTAAVILTIVAGIVALMLRDPAATRTPAASPATTSGSEGTMPVVADDPWTSVIEVTFDGQECVVSGPTSIPVSRGQAFVFTNRSDVLLDLRVGTLGAGSVDDLLEMRRAADGFVYDEIHEFRLQPEPYSFDPSARPAIELAENQILKVYSMSYGTNVIYLVTQTRRPPWTQPGSAVNGLVYPEGLWFCGQLDVTF